jgi:hypothetical protein
MTAQNLKDKCHLQQIAAAASAACWLGRQNSPASRMIGLDWFAE